MSEHIKQQVAARPAAGLSTNRIEAFSDGVFAIALTLLILNVKVPEPESINSEAALQHVLLAQWPAYLSFALSVVIIGIYWVAHHGIFHYVRRADRPLFWLNIFFLLCVTFIPFPTALLGEFSQYQTSVVIYGASLAVTGVALDLIRWYATSRNRLVDADFDVHLNRAGRRRNLTGPFIYAIAILISFLPIHIYSFSSLQICLALYVLVPILYILPGRVDDFWSGRATNNQSR